MLALGLASGCGGDEAADATPGAVRATVLDSQTQGALAGAVAAIEQGTIYAKNPDPTKGNPSYVWGARADASGVFSLELPPGEHGFHVFADGYRYGPKRSEVSPGQTAEITFQLEPEGAIDVQPLVTDVTLTPASVQPGGMFTVEAMVAAGDGEPSSKISEEVLLIAPHAGTGATLDPPAPGCSDGSSEPLGCPDGIFRRTFTAPMEPGAYSYWFVVSSEACVTSDAVELTLTVQ
jgi:hypothetical protein